MKNAITVIVVFLMLMGGSAIFGRKEKDRRLRATAEQVRLIIHFSGELERNRRFLDDQLPMYRKVYPAVPEEYWTRLRESLGAESTYVAMMTPIYQRFFTEKGAEELLALYRTKAWEHVSLVAPLMYSEAKQAGTDLAIRLSRTIATEMALPSAPELR